jgi:hypothetical protein
MKRLPKDDLQTHCKIGQGADTCIWLLIGGKGFECHFHERPSFILAARDNMTAKRDGCERERKAILTLDDKYDNLEGWK